MRGGRNARGVERRHLRRVLEDRPELGRERVELLVGQGQTRELGDVLDLGAGQRGSSHTETLLVRIELAER